jgi:hypothetical protein
MSSPSTIGVNIMGPDSICIDLHACLLLVYVYMCMLVSMQCARVCVCVCVCVCVYDDVCLFILLDLTEI